MTSSPTLSICIPTLNRARFIGETLESIARQLDDRVEVVIVDGGSIDATGDIVRSYASRFPSIRYVVSQLGDGVPSNQGFDRDCDYAVQIARGMYCWLMTDDDLLKANAVATVLDHLDANPELVVVNAEARDVKLNRVLNARLCRIYKDQVFPAAQTDNLFACAGQYLSFVGGVVVRRDVWCNRDRQSFFGSLFVHVGTLFQQPLTGASIVIAEPLIVIRYGNAMWSSRGFEIWMFKWPGLVWSLPPLSDAARGQVTPQEPWRDPGQLMRYRATGSYSWGVFRRFLATRGTWSYRLVAGLVAVCPAGLANAFMTAYLSMKHQPDQMLLYDLLRSPNAWRLTRFAFGGRND
jgi:abequosyltransferase